MTAAPVPIHIKNNRSGETVFRITPPHYEAAAARHPEIAAHVDATIDFDLDRFDESMAEAVALITWDLPTEGLAERAPNLRWIHIIGAGVEHLQPLDWLPPQVTLTNNRGVHAQKAGEYGLMALLMLNNAMPSLIAAQRRREFVECYTTSIDGKTLLVIGTGHIGQAVADQARRLGIRVLGVRRHPAPTAGFDETHGPERLDGLLPRADFVLVALPATPETTGMIDERRIGLLRPDAGLVNMGRAATIDYRALSTALTAGRLAGAVLDVFDPEPLPPTSPLWHVPNLIMTPHMSSDDRDAYVPLTLDLVFENLARLLAGEQLLNAVDPARGY